MIELRITDTGAGIGPGDLKEMGRPFFTTRAGKVGLGVAIAKRIAQAYGGELVYESNVGKERPFGFVFLWSGAKPCPIFLIIDDEADMRFAVRMLLERSGYSVREAENGEMALTRLEEGVPDLALLDMRLPGMDGIQILQKIHEKQKNLPIIMVTGYGNTELAEQALQLGAEHYLSKPFHNKELIDVIGNFHESRGAAGFAAPDPSAPAIRGNFRSHQSILCCEKASTSNVPHLIAGLVRPVRCCRSRSP